MPSAFLSYSWESEEHRAWVRRLGTDLRTQGVDAWLDQWELQLGDDVTHFMETAVTTADFVILICTEPYATKANSRTGGVGYEQAILTAELLTSHHPRGRFVCVLRSGTPSLAIPHFMKARHWLDFRDDGQYQEALHQLLIHLFRRYDDRRPQLGSSGVGAGDTAMTAAAGAQPRGWVLVAGTGILAHFTPRLADLSAYLGAELASGGYGLITGGWPGVDETVNKSFCEAASKLGLALEDRFVQVVGGDEEPPFAVGQLFFLMRGEEQAFVPILIRRADAVILLGGQGGPWATGKMALEMRKPVFPLAATGGDAEEMYSHMLTHWDRVTWLNVNQTRFRRLASPHRDAVNAAIELLLEAIPKRGAA